MHVLCVLCCPRKLCTCLVSSLKGSKGSQGCCHQNGQGWALHSQSLLQTETLWQTSCFNKPEADIVSMNEITSPFSRWWRHKQEGSLCWLEGVFHHGKAGSPQHHASLGNIFCQWQVCNCSASDGKQRPQTLHHETETCKYFCTSLDHSFFETATNFTQPEVSSCISELKGCKFDGICYWCSQRHGIPIRTPDNSSWFGCKKLHVGSQWPQKSSHKSINGTSGKVQSQIKSPCLVLLLFPGWIQS